MIYNLRYFVPCRDGGRLSFLWTLNILVLKTYPFKEVIFRRVLYPLLLNFYAVPQTDNVELHVELNLTSEFPLLTITFQASTTNLQPAGSFVSHLTYVLLYTGSRSV